jgi:hypothetical protein
MSVKMNRSDARFIREKTSTALNLNVLALDFPLPLPLPDEVVLALAVEPDFIKMAFEIGKRFSVTTYQRIRMVVGNQFFLQLPTASEWPHGNYRKQYTHCASDNPALIEYLRAREELELQIKSATKYIAHCTTVCKTFGQLVRMIPPIVHYLDSSDRESLGYAERQSRLPQQSVLDLSTARMTGDLLARAQLIRASGLIDSTRRADEIEVQK